MLKAAPLVTACLVATIIVLSSCRELFRMENNAFSSFIHIQNPNERLFASSIRGIPIFLIFCFALKRRL